MIINRIRVKNFGSFIEAEYCPQKGITGIFGDCGTKEASNGSGKSTLLEAILFALYGKSARGNLQDVYSDYGTDDLEVELEFSLWNNYYRILRTWSPKGGSFLKLYEDKKPFEGNIDEVQGRILEIIKLPYSVFIAISFFLQGKGNLFTAAKSAPRLEYVREILLLSFWDKCYDLTSKKLRTYESDQVKCQNLVAAEKLYISEHEGSFSEDSLKELKIKKEKWGKKVAELVVEQKALLELKQSQQDTLGQINVVNEKIELNRKVLDRILSAKSDLTDALKRIHVRTPAKVYRFVDGLSSKDVQKDKYQLTRELAEVNILLKQEQSFLSSAPDKACPTCRRPVEKGDLDGLKQEALKKKDALDVARRNFVSKIKEDDESLEVLETYQSDNLRAPQILQDKLSQLQLSKQLKKADDDVLNVSNEMAHFKKTLSDLNQSLGDMAEIDKQIQETESARSRADSICNKTDAQITSIEIIKTHIEKAQNKLKQFEFELDAAGCLVRDFKVLKGVFSKTGISFFVIQQVVKQELEKLANEFLRQLSTFRVQFAFESSTGKPTLDIIICNGQIKRKYETYSGGEKALIDFSIRMALSELLSKRKVGGRVEFVVLDEIFGALDSKNKGALETMLAMLRKRFEQLFVVSHIPLDISFDSIVVVKKRNEVSELVM